LRCYLPAQKFVEHGVAEAVVVDARYDRAEISHILGDWADIVVFQYPITEAKLHYIEWAKERGRPKIVVEMDDNPWKVSPFNLMGYPGFGTEEVWWSPPGAKEPEPLWLDASNPVARERNVPRSRLIDIEANRKRHEIFTRCLELADLATTPSKHLADVFREHNENVLVWPNCLDFRYWKPYRARRSDPDFVRIGWHGGISHYEDWHSVTKPLRKVIRRNKKTKLIIFGSAFPATLKGFPKKRMEWCQWCDVKMFPFVLAWLQFDIGICPLLPNEFSRCKSAIKFAEYGALGIPVVASDCPPYSDAIKPGRTGFLAGDDEDWVEALEELINDPDRRREVGAAAMCAVREEYDIDRRIHDLAAAYRSLLDGDTEDGPDESSVAHAGANAGG